MAAKKIIISFLIALVLSEGVISELATWRVRDTSNRTCSLMEMDAVIIHPTDKSLRVEVPGDAELQPPPDTCPTEETTFKLTWTDAGYTWQIAFYFNVSEDSESYTLVWYTGSVEPVTEDGYRSREWGYTEHSYPTLAVGNSFVCNYFVAVGARMSDVRWQPFANLSNGEFGPGEKCLKGLSGGESFAIFLVALMAILLAIFVVVFSNPGRKRIDHNEDHRYSGKAES